MVRDISHHSAFIFLPFTGIPQFRAGSGDLSQDVTIEWTHWVCARSHQISFFSDAPEAFVANQNHLYVVTCVFNAAPATLRTKLYHDFVRHMRSFSNVTVITVELAFGDTPFVVTHADHPWHIQRRTNEVMWYKENLLNIAFRSLPKDATVAWIDADVAFTNPHWVEDTFELLHHHKVVQLFEYVKNLGPTGEVCRPPAPGLVYSWIDAQMWPERRFDPVMGQPGGAWAARIETLQEIGYLIDWDIVGASDRHAAMAFLGLAPHNQVTCAAKNTLWASRVAAVVEGRVSYVDGDLLHFFHGDHTHRGYGTRGAILVHNDYDPDHDVAYRDDGLLCFGSNKPQLRHDLAEHFHDQAHQANAPETLYLVTCVFNPSNYRSRYNRYVQFADYISQFPNVQLTTIELAIGDQDFTVTQADHPHHIQMRTDQVLWYKENLLNLAITSLPPEADKIAWVDCDVQWDNPVWVQDTLTALDRHPVVQMFEQWQNLDEHDQPDGPPKKSFAKRYLDGTQTDTEGGATGLAWAARRSVLVTLGGLIDWGIVGSGDFTMAYGFIGRVHTDAHRYLSRHPTLASLVKTYDAALSDWVAMANVVVSGQLGCVPGTLRHFFHGKHVNRGYAWRWTILAEHDYDPMHDCTHLPNGLICLSQDKTGLQEDIIQYFTRRQEDTLLLEAQAAD